MAESLEIESGMVGAKREARLSTADITAVQGKSAPLERNQRLSHSLIWRLMRNFYHREGIDAWRRARIPLHITSNPFIAAAYAKVIEGFLADCRDELNPDQPIYVLEFGAGHGRFGFLLLKALLEIQRPADAAPIRYVLTDLAERNVEYWDRHPQLRPFFEAGVLDVAVTDLNALGDLRLRNSGSILSPGTVANPIIAVANYVFDSIPQDAFCVRDGQLHENLITINSNRVEPDPEASDVLSRAQVSFTPNLAPENYYDIPSWNVLLEETRRRLPSCHFLFPVTPLKCIDWLQRISGERCVLISADKGYSRDEALMAGLGAPGIVPHADGCFSMMVDYRIIGDYVERLGGIALHPSHPHESLNVSTFVIGETAGAAFRGTRRAFEEAVERFGPDDIFTLTPVLESAAMGMTMEQTIACMRLSRMDFRLVWVFLPLWKARAGEWSAVQKRELLRVIRAVWDRYYPIGEEEDLAFHLGVLLLEFGLYSESLEFLKYSEAQYGAESGTAYNMGVCYFHLRERQKAVAEVDRALALYPDFDAAKALRVLIGSSL